MRVLKPMLLMQRDLNTIRGKVLAGHATQDDMFCVFGHIDCLEQAMDDACEKCPPLDACFPDGWRAGIGLPDA